MWCSRVPGTFTLAKITSKILRLLLDFHFDLTTIYEKTHQNVRLLLNDRDMYLPMNRLESIKESYTNLFKSIFLFITIDCQRENV